MQNLDEFVAQPRAPSLRAESSGSGLPDADPRAFADEPNGDAPFRHDRWDGEDVDFDGPEWRCVTCDSAGCIAVMGGWQCIVCSAMEFYDPSVPQRTVPHTGTWMYLPHGQPEQ